MARSALLAFASAGMFVGTLALSFLGCYGDLKIEKGTCVPPTMALDECTIPKCNADGTPAYAPVPDAEKRPCVRGENQGFCVGGACELTCIKEMTQCKCNDAATDCPTSNFCGTWACTMGECLNTPTNEGMTADPLMPGDCQKKICQNGALKVADDDLDTAVDVKGDCLAPTCTMGVPGTTPNDTDAPAMDDVKGDCNKPACKDGVLGKGPDTTDIPPASGCMTFGCNADGTVAPANAPVGDKCGPNMDMACDRVGMCVSCLPAGKDDYDKCKMNNGNVCPVPKCDGQPCTTKSECKMECADGVCCDTTCIGECKSCAVPGKGGTCTNIPYLGADDVYTDAFGNMDAKCDGLFLCNGSGKCLGASGATCTADAACLGGKCAMPSKLCLGAKDEACTANGQCASGTCTNNKCT